MKYLVIAGLMLSTPLFSQRAAISSDSSSIQLAPGVQIGAAERNTIRLRRAEARILVTHVNFLSDMLAVCKRKVQLLERNDSLQQASIRFLEEKHALERRRAENLKSAITQLENAAATYDERLRTCSADLLLAAKRTSKQKRKSFVNGMLVGAGAGAVIFCVSTFIQD